MLATESIGKCAHTVIVRDVKLSGFNLETLMGERSGRCSAFGQVSRCQEGREALTGELAHHFQPMPRFAPVTKAIPVTA